MGTIDFLYSLPIWVTTLLVLGMAVAIGLGSSLGLRALFRIRATDEERKVAVNLMQVVAAYIGIMIAFAGVEAWQDFAKAQAAVHREATTAADLYRDLTTYGPETQAARNDLRVYIASVVTDEFPLLSQGKASPFTEVALARLFNGIGKVRPQNQRETAVYAAAFSELNDLVLFRRDRLLHSQSGIPLILWAVGLFGSILTVAYTATFSPTRIKVIMISGISLTLGLMFLFILTVDRPFKGEFSVSSAELARLSYQFDMLDRRHGDMTAPNDSAS